MLTSSVLNVLDSRGDGETPGVSWTAGTAVSLKQICGFLGVTPFLGKLVHDLRVKLDVFARFCDLRASLPLTELGIGSALCI